MPVNHTDNVKSTEHSASLQPFVMLFVMIVVGLLIALPLLPGWVQNLSYSFTGDKPRIYWYLSRAAGLVSLGILWLSMALGLSLTNKMARVWPGASTAFTLHEYVSLLGLAFAVYHGLVLMGDHFVDFSISKLMLPFSIKYQTFWTGLGQLAFYVWLFVALSFYIRQRIGQKTWRKIHFLNFVTYVMGLSHGIYSGSDTAMTWARAYYWFSALSLLGLLGYRIYMMRAAQKNTARAKPVTQNPQPAQKVPAKTEGVSQKQPAPEAKVGPSSASVDTNKPEADPLPVSVKDEIPSEPAPLVVSVKDESPPQSAPIQKKAETISESIVKDLNLVSTPLKSITGERSAKSENSPTQPQNHKMPPSPTLPAFKRNTRSGAETQSPAAEDAVTKMMSRIRKNIRADIVDTTR